MPDPWTNPLPPDTRAIGTGNPPLDMDGVSDALAAMGAGLNVLNPAFGAADPNGSLDSTSAFVACTAAAAAAGAPMIIPAGSYKITSALNWKLPGLTVITGGRANTRITQFTNNVPILQVAGQHQRIGGMTLAYNTVQTSGNTGAIAVTFGDDTVGSSFESVFEDFYITSAQTGLGIDPGIVTVAGLFSCYFGNMKVLGYSASGISLVGNNAHGVANCTGCVFDNTYIHNNPGGTNQTSTSRPLNLQSWDEITFNQLNLEHMLTAGDALALSFMGNTVINSLHYEDVQIGGSPGNGHILMGQGTGTVVINGLTIRFPVLSGASYNTVARFSAAATAGSLIINGLNAPVEGTVTTPALPLADFGTGVNGKVTVNGAGASPNLTAVSVNGGLGSKVQWGSQPASIDYAPAGALAETFPRQHATTVSGGLTPGTVYGRVISLPAGIPLTGAGFVTGTTAKTGGTHGWYVLMDMNGKVLAVTADKTDAATTWGTISTPYPVNWTAVAKPLYDGDYILGLMVNETAGTMPTFAVCPGGAGGINGMTPVLAGTSSAAQTTPPAVGATLTVPLVTTAGNNLYGYVF